LANIQDLPKLPPSRLTRRSFLQLLVATGGSLLAARLLRALGSIDRSTYSDRIKNIIVFIQENHSFESLFAGFPGANSKFSDWKSFILEHCYTGFASWRRNYRCKIRNCA
jgi:hypothetical protein